MNMRKYGVFSDVTAMNMRQYCVSAVLNSWYLFKGLFQFSKRVKFKREKRDKLALLKENTFFFFLMSYEATTVLIQMRVYIYHVCILRVSDKVNVSFHLDIICILANHLM